MPVNLYYTQKVRGFQQTRVKYSKESVEIHLKRTKHQCPYCGSTAVTVEPISYQKFQARNHYEFLSQIVEEAKKWHLQWDSNPCCRDENPVS